MTFDMKESSQTWWLWMGRSHTKQLVFPSVCSIFELLGSLTLLSGGPPSQEGPEQKVCFIFSSFLKISKMAVAPRISQKKAQMLVGTIGVLYRLKCSKLSVGLDWVG